MAIERTFSMIKPDATKRNLTGAITMMLEDAGLRVVASRRVWMSRREAEGFYAVHKGRPFFDELCDFMSSGPTVVQVLEGEDAIARNREVMGATNPANAAEGRHEIDGDRVFALVQAYQTGPAAERKFEFHRNYADIQFLVAGEEVIEYAPLAGLTIDRPYDPAKDYGLTADPAACSALLLQPGQWAVFFPADAHKPGCCLRERTAVRKVVVKVLL